MHKGSCVCGAVTFEVTGSLDANDACHCSICRKWSGHYWAGADVPRSSITIHGADKVTWYRSSEKVRRGFCSICGSSMFFDPIYKDWFGVSMGALESPTDAKLQKHIFVGDKGDYYEIADGLPQNDP
jgi:hypothetical protein